MKRGLAQIAAALGGSILLSSCMVGSVQPLCPLEQAQADPKLNGDWPSKDKSGETVHIWTVSPHEMRVKFIEKAPQNDTPPATFEVYPTVIDGRHLLSVKWPAPKNETTYLFVRYEISGEHSLDFTLMDEDKVEAAVRAGALKGKIEKHVSQTGISGPVHDVDVRLTDSSANIQTFIRKTGVSTLFDDPLK